MRLAVAAGLPQVAVFKAEPPSHDRWSQRNREAEERRERE
jgi:hypothetical protein